MFDEADRETGFVLALVIALAIVVSLATIGIATGTVIGDIGRKPAAAASAQPARVAATASTDNQRARLYFELGSSELPADALSRVAPLVKAAGDSARFTVSGFHDASGDAAANAELAKQRALAVRELLTSAGVASERIELRKPEITPGGADPREARRVDVTLN
jgi:outer membrane protein OmpA-like peptidoglycan-associated protein